MMSSDVPFHIFVLAACLYIIAIAIVNIVYYYRLYEDDGSANIGKSTAITMVILNIILLVLVALKLIWTIFRMVEADKR